MRIGSVILDTDNMSVEDVNVLINQLKQVRARKSEARSYKQRLASMLEGMKEEGFTFCSQYTGEVLKAEDWLVYDEHEKCVHEGEWH